MDELKTTQPPTAEPKLDKASDDRYMLNTKTNRYVLKSGATGRRLQREMTRAQIVDHINHHASDAIMENRDLIRTDLSDGQLLDILRKLVNIKIDNQLKIEDSITPTQPPQTPPQTPPKLVRQTGEYKHDAAPKPTYASILKKRKKKRSKKAAPQRRYTLHDPPPQPTDTDALSETSSSDAYSD